MARSVGHGTLEVMDRIIQTVLESGRGVWGVESQQSSPFCRYHRHQHNTRAILGVIIIIIVDAGIVVIVNAVDVRWMVNWGFSHSCTTVITAVAEAGGGPLDWRLLDTKAGKMGETS